jgi:hypothetical protein
VKTSDLNTELNLITLLKLKIFLLLGVFHNSFVFRKICPPFHYIFFDMGTSVRGEGGGHIVA